VHTKKWRIFIWFFWANLLMQLHWAIKLRKTKIKKLLKCGFYLIWKFWKIPYNKHLMEVWSWAPKLMISNMEWHGNFLYTSMFYTIMYFYSKKFWLFEQWFVLNMNFFIFLQKKLNLKKNIGHTILSTKNKAKKFHSQTTKKWRIQSEGLSSLNTWS